MVKKSMSGNNIQRSNSYKGNDHRKKKLLRDSDLIRLLMPLIPILLLLLLLLLIQGDTKEQARTENNQPTETETETETEKKLTPEEQEFLTYDALVRSYTESFGNFGVALSDGTVNFRSSPDVSTAENKIGQLHDLDVFELQSEEGDWLKICIDGKTGYVSSLFCTTGEEGREEVCKLLGYEKSLDYKNPGIVHTEGNDIKIFKEPHANDMSLVIGLMEGGNAFDVLEEEGEWLKIRSGDIEGYIRKELGAKGEDAAAIARVKAQNYAHILSSVVMLRSEPEFRNDNVIGSVKGGEWYTVEETVTDAGTDGWIRLSGEEFPELQNENGDAEIYLNLGGGNAEIIFGLREAVKADAKELVKEEYNNLILCVTPGYVNIRSSTNTESYRNIVGKIYCGNGAELLGTVKNSESGDGNTWYHILSGGVDGYVSAGTEGKQFFVTGTEAEDRAVDYAHLTASITTDCLNVRSTPDNTDDKNVWTQVTKGQAYEVLDQEGDWVRIDLGGDEDNDAYIYKGDSFIRLAYGLDEAIEYSYAEKANAFRQSIVDYACKFIGNPYVWGGTSLTNGCDCSGFVQQIMKHYGISMERTSIYQAKQGVKRTSSSMRPGDLIFYANKSGTINHVGIYIGGGYMVGAQSKKAGIKVYKWNYRTPVAIRDVIGERVE